MMMMMMMMMMMIMMTFPSPIHTPPLSHGCATGVFCRKSKLQHKWKRHKQKEKDKVKARRRPTRSPPHVCVGVITCNL